jgi:hypothetical protein
MVSLRRKQGLVSLTSALSEFDAGDRERGFDLLQEAEGVFVEISAPSRLGTSLLSLGLMGLGIVAADPIYGAYAGAAMLGYACRMGQSSPPSPPNDTARVERQLLRTKDGDLDYERMSEQPDRLRGLAGYLANLDERGFYRLLGSSPEAWAVFSAAATTQLHRNLVSNGIARRTLPEGLMLRTLLRVGYPVRFIDEVAGEAPTPALRAG